MTAKQSSTISKCVNALDRSLNDSEVWNSAAWEAVAGDIDLMIGRKRTEILALKKAKRKVLALAKEASPFNWEADEPNAYAKSTHGSTQI